MPVYKLRDDKGELIDYGEIKGSSPTKPYYRKNPDDNKLNTVKGIDYATTGTRLLGNFRDRERR